MSRIRDYASSEQGRTHGKHGAAALAGMVIALAPTLPALYGAHEERQQKADALELCHESQRASHESYTALVRQIMEHHLEDSPE